MPKSDRRKRDLKDQSVAVVEAPPLAPSPLISGNGEAAPAALPENGTEAGQASLSGSLRLPAATTVKGLSNLLTLEVMCYTVIALAALLLRVVNLDARSLTPVEAQTAAAAWEFLNGKPVGAFASPLLFSLDWLTFLLFGAFDLTARFLPAVLGTFVVLVPALGRNSLGRIGALVAALLIALSPSLVLFARTLSGSNLAAGGAVAALLLFWNHRMEGRTRSLYGAAAFAALALTAGSAAYAILVPGALWLVGARLSSRRGTRPEETRADAPDIPMLRRPFVRAGIVFAVVYVGAATTFLLNRDGLGAAFNLLGESLGAFATLGPLANPLGALLVYEPLSLIFGLAGAVLALTLQGESARSSGAVRLLAIVAVAAFLWFSLAGAKDPSDIVSIVLPFALLAGWFVGNLAERAGEDIRVMGGGRTILAGELPILLMLLVLVTLMYLQFATFIQQSRFAPALDVVYRALSDNPSQVSIFAAALTLVLVTLFLLAIFVGLGVLLIGVARTTTLLAFAILLVLGLGMLRATWLLNFSAGDPVRELLVTTQTPATMRALVKDLTWYSELRTGDQHVMSIAADPGLGAVGRWYLRDFVNVTWTAQTDRVQDPQAVLAISGNPPRGDWQGERYHTGVTWAPENFAGLDLWRWFLLRQGGQEQWQTVVLWLPTVK